VACFSERKNQMANPTGTGGFKRGLSGNPGGRPAVSVELRTLARERTPEAMKVLTDIMMDPKAPAAARVAACRELFDRGYGRAESSINAKVETKQTWGPDALDKLPPAERAELARFSKEWGPALDRWTLLIGADENGTGQSQ
jgi:hypothetical protein